MAPPMNFAAGGPAQQVVPLADGEAAAAHYFALKRRRISIEWTMIDGANDSPTQAAGLADIARRLRAHVNLIPLNPTPLNAERPSPKTIQTFVDLLQMRRVPVTVRDTRGKDIDAACGQLAVKRDAGRKRKLAAEDLSG